MPNHLHLAARGDLAAQRALIAETLSYGHHGLSSWSAAVREALCYARLASAQSGATEDARNLLEVLSLCVQDAHDRGDDAARISYAAQLVAEIDGLMDAGDESAGVWLAATMPTIDPKIIEAAKLFKDAWAESAEALATGNPIPSRAPGG